MTTSLFSECESKEKLYFGIGIVDLCIVHTTSDNILSPYHFFISQLKLTKFSLHHVARIINFFKRKIKKDMHGFGRKKGALASVTLLLLNDTALTCVDALNVFQKFFKGNAMKSPISSKPAFSVNRVESVSVNVSNLSS